MSATGGFSALVGGATAISLGVIAVKEGYADGADPGELIAGRMIVAGALVAVALPFVLRGGGGQPAGGRRVGGARRSIGPGAIVVAIAAGALLWVSSRGELEGLARLPAGMLAILLATAPMWVAAIDWLADGVVPSRFERMTMLTIVAGVAVMAAPLGASVDVVGVLSGLVSAMTFALFLFVLGRNRRVSAVQAFPLGIVGAALLALVTSPEAIGDLGGGISTPLLLVLGATQAVWALLVGIGLGATNAVTAAMVVAIEPVLVAVLAFVILEEGLTARALAGGAIVVGSLAAVALRLRVQERARLADEPT